MSHRINNQGPLSRVHQSMSAYIQGHKVLEIMLKLLLWVFPVPRKHAENDVGVTQ